MRRRDFLHGAGVGTLLAGLAGTGVRSPAQAAEPADRHGLNEASYIVYADGGMVYAKNGRTGNTDYESTDATTVIQGAIDAVVADGGGKIFLKKSTYRIRGPLHAIISDASAPLIIESDGAMVVCDPFSTPVSAVMTFEHPGQVDYSYNPVVIRGIQLDVNGAHQPVNDVYQFAGIRLDRIFNAHIENVRILNAAWCGIAVYRFSDDSWGFSDLDHALSTVINSCSFENCGMSVNGIAADTAYGGVFISNWVHGGVISNCVARGCHYGFTVEDASSGIVMDNCIARRSAKSGFSIQYCYGVRITNCLASENENGIWTRGDCRYCVIANNFCTGNRAHGIFSETSRGVIVANSCYHNGDAGIYIGGAVNLVQSNMSVNNGGGAGATYRAGIVLNGMHNDVIGNNCHRDGEVDGWDQVQYGIYECDGQGENFLYLNDVRWNPTPIRMTGPSSVQEHNRGG